MVQVQPENILAQLENAQTSFQSEPTEPPTTTTMDIDKMQPTVAVEKSPVETTGQPQGTDSSNAGL